MDQLERRLVGDLGGVVLEELLLELAVRLHERGRAAAAAAPREPLAAAITAPPESELFRTSRRSGRARRRRRTGKEGWKRRIEIREGRTDE